MVIATMKRHLLLLALLIPTVSNHLFAQYGKPEYHIGLVERTISKAPNGKYILWKYPNKKVISNADSIKLRKNRWYYVWKKGKQGLYNESKERCIPIKYDAIVQITDNLFRVEKNGKKGVYNSNGTKVLSPIYDEIIEKGFWFGNNGCLKVGKDGKYGICNEHGIPITKLIYSKIKGDSYKLELVKGNTSDFLLNYKYLVYDCKTIKDAFSAPVNGIKTEDYFVVEKDSLFGLLNEKGEMVITPQYTKLINRYLGYRYGKTPWLIACNGKKYGIIDINNHIILPFEYKDIRSTKIEDYFSVETESGKHFYDYVEKKFITDYTYDYFFGNGTYTSIKKDGKVTVINNDTKKMMFPYKYQDIISIWSKPYFCVQQNDLYGLIDDNDNLIVPIIYQRPLWIVCKDKVVVYKDGKYGIINLKNELLYGMTEKRIVGYTNFFSIIDSKGEETKLDANLKVIETAK